MKTYAIVLAAGNGSRMNSSTPKQFMKIHGITMLERTLLAFEKHKVVDEIILVSQKHEILESLKKSFKKIKKIVEGGERRQDSVRSGLQAIDSLNGIVLIHDAARPMVSSDSISRIQSAIASGNCAATLAIPIMDTLVQVDCGKIERFVPREKFMCIQTPQAFDLETIKVAHNLLRKRPDVSVTDDCSLVKLFALAEIEIVAGDKENFKITNPSDLKIAEKFIN